MEKMKPCSLKVSKNNCISGKAIKVADLFGKTHKKIVVLLSTAKNSDKEKAKKGGMVYSFRIVSKIKQNAIPEWGSESMGRAKVLKDFIAKDLIVDKVSIVGADSKKRDINVEVDCYPK